MISNVISPSCFASLGLLKVLFFYCPTIVRESKEIKVVSRVWCSFNIRQGHGITKKRMVLLCGSYEYNHEMHKPCARKTHIYIELPTSHGHICKAHSCLVTFVTMLNWKGGSTPFYATKFQLPVMYRAWNKFLFIVAPQKTKKTFVMIELGQVLGTCWWTIHRGCHVDE